MASRIDSTYDRAEMGDGAPPPKRVVVIDDSQIVLAMVEAELTDAGYQVVCLLEPQMIDGPVDLILLDIQMPQIYGDDAARWLRDIQGVQAPIYLVSSIAEDELANRAAKAGVDGYICKNWGIERLVAVD